MCLYFSCGWNLLWFNVNTLDKWKRAKWACQEQGFLTSRWRVKGIIYLTKTKTSNHLICEKYIVAELKLLPTLFNWHLLSHLTLFVKAILKQQALLLGNLFSFLLAQKLKWYWILLPVALPKYANKSNINFIRFCFYFAFITK